jgi:hypothetical protein
MTGGQVFNDAITLARRSLAQSLEPRHDVGQRNCGAQGRSQARTHLPATSRQKRWAPCPAHEKEQETGPQRAR